MDTTGTVIEDAAAREKFEYRILDASPAGILITRIRDGNILYANRAIGKLLGIEDASAIIGTPVPNFYGDPAERAVVLGRFRADGLLENYEMRARRMDGSLFWVAISLQPFTFDGEAVILSTVIDITKRKEAEQRLLESEQRLQALFNALPQPVIVTQVADGTVVYANQQLSTLIGIPLEQMMGMRTPDYYFNPADRARFVQALQQEGRVRGAEIRLKKGDGSPFWAEITIEMVVYQGAPATIAIIEDISERKRLEEEIQQSFDRRGHQVQVSTEISQEIAAAPELSMLFERVVTLVKERLGYYHTQLLRFDPAHDAMMLAAGYGEIGAKMLAAGHHMPIGRGLIGAAAAKGVTVLRRDLSAGDPDWQPNPLLSETKGEIAVPIKLGARVLGVLDVQSDRASALSDDDRLLLEGLCGQIAIAIEQTRLRQEMEERLQEINTLYRSMSREGWDTFRRAESFPDGFIFDQTGVRPLGDDPNVDEKQFVSAPLTVPGGEAVGVMAVSDDPERPLSSEDHSFLQQISEQVALALESARLFAQTQASLAATQESEQLVRNIIDSTPDWIFIKDREHRYRLVNKGYADALHIAPEDFLGKNDLELGFPEELVKGNPEKGIRGFWADDLAVMESGAPVINPNDPATIDGEIHIFNTFKTALRDAEGRPWGVLAFARDVTERERVQQAVAQRARELSQVADLGTKISAILDPVQMLQTVVDLAKSHFRLYHAHIYLLHETGDLLTLAAGAGDVGRTLVSQGWEIPLDRERSLVARAARTHQGVIVNDVRDDPDFLPNDLLPETRSELAVPLIVGQQVLGVLDIQADSPNRFSDEDVSIYTVLASQVAVALQNSRTYAQTQRQAEYEGLVNTISQKIQSTTTVENALQVAVRELGRALGASKASVQLGLTRKK
jgi:PAS domain S-box-containing protein